MHLRSSPARIASAAVAAVALTVAAVPANAADGAKPGPAGTGALTGHGAATELENGEEVLLSGTGKYVYDATFIYYSVVAVRSEGGKPSISLYADEANETLLVSSNEKKRKTDFVVVDSNHALVPTTYFPTAASKAGSSTVELDNDAVILSNGIPVTFDLTEDDVVISSDAFVETGVTYKITVTVDGDADPALYLMQSGGTAETSYLSAADAVAKADKKGGGKSESITITGGEASDWLGVVLINNSGSGTYTITKTVVT